MGKTNFTKCKEIISSFRKGEEVGFFRLQAKISMMIGGDPRTIANAVRTMLNTKLIKDIGQMHFEVL